MNKPFLSLALIGSVLAISCNSGTSTKSSGEAMGVSMPDSITKIAVQETSFPEKVYWGDQHVHTAWSGDAGAAGTRVGPEDAVRFAMGEAVKNSTGNMVKLAHGLDWVAISDHSDGMGTIASIMDGDPDFMTDTTLKRWHDLMNSGDDRKSAMAAMELITAQSTGKLPKQIMSPKFMQSVWERNNAIMDKYYKPGSFTSFIAYEWTSNYGGGNNLHRNIIYRDNAATANKVTPLTTFVSEDPEGLWKWMQAYEDKTGGKILAIPHNGNLSNGLMFSLSTLAGQPMTREYAETRQKWEVLYEVTQVKGTSEAHPSLSPTDEFANFEIWDKGNLGYQTLKKPGDVNKEYAREALKDGLVMEQKLGVNPFKYGLVGGTDTHTGLSTADEDNFNGKFKTSEEKPERWTEVISKYKGGIQKGWELGASGWTGVWAKSNTREALWDAMKRRETYATTGPRITVRLFGGYDFTADDLKAADMAARGYQRGVPMGGDLAAAPAGKKPSFLVKAVKDPSGANLDRAQVVKGWVDAKGVKHEKIFEVAWADTDKRKLNAKGKLPAVGNSVNMETLEVGSDIGDPELATVWTDPEFDPAVSCFYYVRVLEIPTPRWTAYDRKKFNLKMDANVPMVQQSRCYTSPIWYTPKK